MSSQPFNSANWPTVCKQINSDMEILFGGHNYVFRPDGDEIIFMASEQRLPHTVVEKIKLPDNVTLLKTSTGATKLKSQNPFDIFTVVAASVQLI